MQVMTFPRWAAVHIRKKQAATGTATREAITENLLFNSEVHFYGTLTAAVRAVIRSSGSALALAVSDCEPAELSLCEPFKIDTGDAPGSYSCQILELEPGALGLDFAAAVSLCQMRAAALHEAAGDLPRAAHYVEVAQLSAGLVTSWRSAEILELLAERGDLLQWPEGRLWPNGVEAFLESNSIPVDRKG